MKSISVESETCVPIHSDQDIVAARQKGRLLAIELGFSAGDATLIATAISELARNIVRYARSGEVRLTAIQNSTRSGIQLVAHDAGPGIADIPQAMRASFRTRTKTREFSSDSAECLDRR